MTSSPGWPSCAADPATPATVLVTHHVEEIPEGFTHLLLLGEGRVMAVPVRSPTCSTRSGLGLPGCRSGSSTATDDGGPGRPAERGYGYARSGGPRGRHAPSRPIEELSPSAQRSDSSSNT